MKEFTDIFDPSALVFTGWLGRAGLGEVSSEWVLLVFC